MNTIKSQIDDLQTKIKELRTKKREEKLQTLQSQYNNLVLKKHNTTDPLYFTDNIPVLFNTFFTKTDNFNDILPLKLIWHAIKNSEEYEKMVKIKNTGRDQVYKYVKNLYNIQPNIISHQTILIRGIRKISI